MKLHTLVLTDNKLKTAADVEHLKECQSISVLVRNSRINKSKSLFHKYPPIIAGAVSKRLGRAKIRRGRRRPGRPVLHVQLEGADADGQPPCEGDERLPANGAEQVRGADLPGPAPGGGEGARRQRRLEERGAGGRENIQGGVEQEGAAKDIQRGGGAHEVKHIR